MVVCFQPHLYPARDFWRELAGALELADLAIVMDVCGDGRIPGIDGGWSRTPYAPARQGDLQARLGRGSPTSPATPDPATW